MCLSRFMGTRSLTHHRTVRDSHRLAKIKAPLVAASLMSMLLCMGVFSIASGVLVLKTASAEVLQASSDKLTALVNPILQKYYPDANTQSWKLDSSTWMLIDAKLADNARLLEVVHLMQAEFKAKLVCNSELTLAYGASQDVRASDIWVTLVPVAAISSETDSDEAYKIEIDDTGVRISAASENAALYALRTLENILVVHDGTVPAGTIVDWPELKERRLFIDNGRKYFSKAWWIQLIHDMSYMKYNTLDMHFSENRGFRIESETDPSIVSAEHLTKAEVREILNEARLYGIKVIPSLDSPGHVDQILRAHPEYGQVSIKGEHLSSGLDITNPEAVAYIKKLYKEYIDLFKEVGATTEISIGCDEYMEFDRPPFTTEYRPVLTAWAKEHLGAEYTWTDTVATYINDLAEFCKNEGLTPLVFNDGIYYGAGSRIEQKVRLHEYVGVDFWSQMSWNRSIANLSDLLERGVTRINNWNANYGYFVLRNNERGASFDFDDSLERWWNQWRPGDFQDKQNAHTLADDDPRIVGATIAVWCDFPDVATEDQISAGIAKEMRAMAARSWRPSSNTVLQLDEFKELIDTLGHGAAYEKGERLALASDVLSKPYDSSVVVSYLDENDQSVSPEKTLRGRRGDSYHLEIPELEGFVLHDPHTVEALRTGIFAEGTTNIVIRYASVFVPTTSSDDDQASDAPDSHQGSDQDSNQDSNQNSDGDAVGNQGVVDNNTSKQVDHTRGKKQFDKSNKNHSNQPSKNQFDKSNKQIPKTADAALSSAVLLGVLGILLIIWAAKLRCACTTQ